MMKMKKTISMKIFATLGVITLAIAILFTGNGQVTLASSGMWFDDDSYDNYFFDEPYYDDYSYDFFEPYYNDYSYDFYEPFYDDSYFPTYTPSFSSPIYYPTVTTPTVDYGYIPQPYPIYTPTAQGSAQSQTQSNVSSNTNTNTNTSSSNNVNNNVNTNNVNIVFGTPISGSTYYPPNNATLDGNCTISPSNVSVNQEVRFTANASGGNGNYTYSWTGTDGVSASGQTFTGRYQFPGLKTATVTISSGGQSITRSCSVSVDQNTVIGNNLGVYCLANPSSVNVGQTIVWTAYPSGGNGFYTYSWTGNDSLSFGNASAIQKVYTTGGTKTATVTVFSGGQSISATCSANVTGGSVLGAATVIREPNAGTPISGVFLSEVPATGIDGNLKVFLFVLGLALWSGFLGYIVVTRSKKSKLVLQANGNSSTESDLHARIQAFKLANMQKKGLVK